MRMRFNESGQATVELVAVLPLVVLVTLALWQAVVAGQAASLAGSAARAAARAQALGTDAPAAARAVLPRALQPGLRVTARGDGSVRVAVGVPAVLGDMGRVGTVSAVARFVAQGAS
jgi:TadE-like protein